MTDFLDCMRPPEPKTEHVWQADETWFSCAVCGESAPAPHEAASASACPGVPPITRTLPCPRTTWCTLADGHTGDCHEVPRRELPPSDFGPDAAKRRRW